MGPLGIKSSNISEIILDYMMRQNLEKYLKLARGKLFYLQPFTMTTPLLERQQYPDSGCLIPRLLCNKGGHVNQNQPIGYEQSTLRLFPLFCLPSMWDVKPGSEIAILRTWQWNSNATKNREVKAWKSGTLAGFWTAFLWIQTRRITSHSAKSP